MSYKELTFDDYINSLLDIHNKATYTTLQDNIINNIIVYGPVGVGKYTLCLSAIQHISPTNLKYSKKIWVSYEKTQYAINMSDVHYEIDISQLCYGSTMLWHEIFQQILDSITFPIAHTPRIILCKEFQDITSELLEVMYIYMQDSRIRFMILTTSIGFIPSNIISACTNIIAVSKPSKTKYTALLKHMNKSKPAVNTINIRYPSSKPNHIHICNTIISHILDITQFDYLTFRNIIYEMLTYNLDIHHSIWYILRTLLENNAIPIDSVNDVMVTTITMLAKYNNNYHNIYHLEYFCCYLVSIIHAT